MPWNTLKKKSLQLKTMTSSGQLKPEQPPMTVSIPDLKNRVVTNNCHSFNDFYWYIKKMVYIKNWDVLLDSLCFVPTLELILLKRVTFVPISKKIPVKNLISLKSDLIKRKKEKHTGKLIFQYFKCFSFLEEYMLTKYSAKFLQNVCQVLKCSKIHLKKVLF